MSYSTFELKKMKYFIILILNIVLFSCGTNDQTYLRIEMNDSNIDSLFITDIVTGEILAGLDLHKDHIKYPLSVDSLKVGIIRTKDDAKSQLMMIGPNTRTSLKITSDSSITTSSMADSLLNYMHSSNNKFIGQFQNFIFTTTDKDSIVDLFKSFEQERRQLIESNDTYLSRNEKALLHFQNKARINSFLLFFGRISMGLPADDSFFNFIEDIDVNTKWAKSLPINILYTHEINYLLQNDSLTDINRFINFIDSNTSNGDLFSFMKAYYLKEIIESPSYWQNHYKLFNTVVLKQALDAEINNPYYHIVERPSNYYFTSRVGEPAFDFTAQKIDSSHVKLSDYKGKIVFVDTWATWCGACIVQKPQAMALAEKYKYDPRVKVLFISVDASKKRWVNYLTLNNELDYPNNFFIKNGMRTKYGDNFNIKSIPRYILIDRNGVIINGNISEPSKAVVDMIENELKSM